MPAHRKELHVFGSNLWYLVGLVASDGCLSSDGRHIDITSKDYQLLSTVKELSGVSNKIAKKHNAKSQIAYHIQIGSKNFYNFLLSVGLTPNKSLTLGALKVPGKYFTEFLRGLIDGDGSIRKWAHPGNNKEQWSLRIYSGSKNFIQWVKDNSEFLLKVGGRIHQNGEALWVLKYGKMATRVIAEKCYYKDCFGLKRKIKLAQQCFNSYRGWDRSKTVCCEPA